MVPVLVIVVWFHCRGDFGPVSVNLCSQSFIIMRHDAAVDTTDHTWMMDLTIMLSKLHWLNRGRCSIIPLQVTLNATDAADCITERTLWPQCYQTDQLYGNIFLIHLKSTQASPLLTCDIVLVLFCATPVLTCSLGIFDKYKLHFVFVSW